MQFKVFLAAVAQLAVLFLMLPALAQLVLKLDNLSNLLGVAQNTMIAL